MSQVKISGNASGTGVLTISAPNTDTDRTLSLPDNTGTILTTESSTPPKVPMFHAQRSTSQALTNNTTVEVIFDQENFDSEGWYDHTTGRFTPQTAGYYLITSTVGIDISGNSFSFVSNSFLFNGGTTAVGSGRVFLMRGVADKDEFAGGASNIIYFNGSTDYVSMGAYIIATSGTRTIIGGTTYGQTFFCGHLLREGSI